MRYMALILSFIVVVTPASADVLKTANVAGQFYPGDAKELALMVDGFLNQAKDAKTYRQSRLIIAPHAGYVYSGPIAGYAYQAIAQQHPKTVIIIAPSHYASFQGAALWPQGEFQTPLGNVPVDEKVSKVLQESTPGIIELPTVFDREHALEVQLPFVQRVLGDKVKIVPVLMGQPDIKFSEQLAMSLNKIMNERQDVIVIISTDMSHYHPYDDANAMDANTLDMIRRGDLEGFWNGHLSGQVEMCGFVGVMTGMMLAKLQGLGDVEVFKYANSGDTAPASKAKGVVGYQAIGFYPVITQDRLNSSLTDVQHRELLRIARTSIETYIRTGEKTPLQVTDARLNQVQGAFVTIQKDGQLRGCIGHVIGQYPLAQTVQEVAIAAATEDPRFNRLSVDELAEIKLEVSVLSVPTLINDTDEIILGTHGVILSDGKSHQGVFLPQVATETGWDKEQFLNELCQQKAGLTPECWKNPLIKLYTFTADITHEQN